jgi:Sulfotransferase domain
MGQGADAVVTVIGFPRDEVWPPGPRRPAVLALWSPPKSLSTAFYRMMAQRGDFQLYHEPFSDLAETKEYRLGERTVNDPDSLLDEILRVSAGVPVFFKDTTVYRHCELFADPRLFYDVVHTFIIRDPRRTIASHYAVNPQVTRDEIGYEYVYEIFDLVREATGRVPTVLDADVLLSRPVDTVRAYCASVGIPFDEDALRWEPGEPTEWRRTSRWHRDASRGSAFERRDRGHPARGAGHLALAGHLEYHLPFYEKMREFALAVPECD